MDSTAPASAPATGYRHAATRAAFSETLNPLKVEGVRHPITGPLCPERVGAACLLSGRKCVGLDHCGRVRP